MQIVLDTNILIRFFTNDIPEKAQKVKKLLDSGENLFIPDVVFPEIEYILQTQYKQTRENIIKTFQSLRSHSNITISSDVKIAITHYESTKLDMADCIIVAYSLKGQLASFDRELLKVAEVNSYWK